MKTLTKKILIWTIGFLLLVEIVALALPEMPVISHVARDYRLKVFSIPFAVSMLVSHFWVSFLKPKWWNPLIWATSLLAVIYFDFFTKFTPDNSGYFVLAGLLIGIFWPQKVEG